MSDAWFTVERIDGRTWAISEYGHWERAHSYLFVGSERAALVDTGVGIGDIAAPVRRLTAGPVVVLTTHAHWDHMGGHTHFDDRRVHADDAGWMRHGLPVPIEDLRRTLMREPLTTDPPDDFDPDRWEPFRGEPTQLLRHGQTIDLGDRTLRIIHTPGHSPGHVCVHEPATGLLCTGDLVYRGMLYAYYPSTDPDAFASSVARLADLPDVRRLLPGHNALDGLDGETLTVLATRLGDLRARGLLRHGTGTHAFDGLGISIRL